jgi:muramoyltetrapeptide carboxypeptidase
MDFIKPRRLIPGKSIIGLIAPSGILDEKDKNSLEKSLKIIKNWGFEVKLGKYIFAKRKDFCAGETQERFADFLEMVNNHEVGAIGCLIGGYALLDLLKLLTSDVCQEIIAKPKIIFGYSDFSLILNVLFSQKMIGFHAPNVAGLYQRSLNTQKSLLLSLIGEDPLEIGPWFDWKPLRKGFAKGRLLVSNLESLINLLGTDFDPLVKSEADLILALEEVGESKSTLNRWLQKLAIHSQAAKIKGIILGRFTKIGEKFYPSWGEEMGVEQLFETAFGRRKIPLASWPEFGHIEEKTGIFKISRTRERVDFYSLPSGVEAILKVKDSSCRLKFLERPLI